MYENDNILVDYKVYHDILSDFVECHKITTPFFKIDKYNREVFFYSAEHNYLAFVDGLLMAGMPVDVSNEASRTPLLLASEAGKTRIMLTLIINGACLEWADDAGYTALILAISSGHIKAVELLIDAGAE